MRSGMRRLRNVCEYLGLKVSGIQASLDLGQTVQGLTINLKPSTLKS